jgi:DNA-binding protein H-NS
MALNLEALSPKELQDLIATAQSKMKAAQANHVQTVRKKIDALLKSAGLTLADVYPTRGGKKSAGKKGTGSVSPKYRNPANASETWSGRGRQPIWFAGALKKRGVTAESMLIGGAPKAASTKKTPVKKAKKAAKPKA